MSSTSITSQDARTIYEVKRAGKTRHDAARLAVKYGITAKAVRDIWTHRTWKHATVSLWTLHDFEEYIKAKVCMRCNSAAEAFLTNTTGGRAKCGWIVQEILGAKKDHSYHNGTERHGRVSTPMPPLVCRMDQVWIRKNAHLGGLMDEALDTVS
jgi:hypothetical protein